MTRSHVLVILAAMLAAWGCSNSPAPPASELSAADRSKPLEAKVAKLDEDLRQTRAARDAAQAAVSAARAATAAAEEKLREEAARGRAVEKDRDDLRAGLKAKTAEKDALQVQYDGFRKTLRDVLGQAEAAAAPPPAVGGSASAVELPAPRGL